MFWYTQMGCFTLMLYYHVLLYTSGVFYTRVVLPCFGVHKWDVLHSCCITMFWCTQVGCFTFVLYYHVLVYTSGMFYTLVVLPCFGVHKWDVLHSCCITMFWCTQVGYFTLMNVVLPSFVFWRFSVIFCPVCVFINLIVIWSMC